MTAVLEEQALLRDSVRDALAAGADWAQLDELGVWSVLEPPEGSLAMAVVVAEELGRGLFSGPAYEAMVGGYLAGACAQDGRFAFVDDGAPNVELPSGTALLVASGDTVGRGEVASATENPSMDEGRRTVLLTVAGAGALAATPERARAARSLLYAADTLGSIEHVLDKTVEYAKQRKTFGSPIGKYQAVAHRLVDHTVTARQLRVLRDAAVTAFDDDSPELLRLLATAETFGWDRGTAIISDCIQLCGGIGFTWEWGHHFYLRRVVQNAVLGLGYGRPHDRMATEAGW